MPRMPQAPTEYCGSNHCCSGSIDDIKLKKLESKLEKQIAEKLSSDLNLLENLDMADLDKVNSFIYVQDKNGNPKKLSLAELSAEQEKMLLLGKDIIVSAPAGKYKKGDIIKADENIKNVIENVLTKEETPEPDMKIYVYNGLLPLEKEDFFTQEGWNEFPTTSELIETGFKFTHYGERKHYLSFAYPKELGELKYIYQNELYSWSLLESFIKYNIADAKGKEYILYECEDAMIGDEDEFEFLWK